MSTYVVRAEAPEVHIDWIFGPYRRESSAERDAADLTAKGYRATVVHCNHFRAHEVSPAADWVDPNDRVRREATERLRREADLRNDRLTLDELDDDLKSSLEDDRR
jgi:hypothetical protein